MEITKTKKELLALLGKVKVKGGGIVNLLPLSRIAGSGNVKFDVEVPDPYGPITDQETYMKFLDLYFYTIFGVHYEDIYFAEFDGSEQKLTVLNTITSNSVDNDPNMFNPDTNQINLTGDDQGSIWLYMVGARPNFPGITDLFSTTIKRDVGSPYRPNLNKGPADLYFVKLNIEGYHQGPMMP